MNLLKERDDISSKLIRVDVSAKPSNAQEIQAQKAGERGPLYCHVL